MTRLITQNLKLKTQNSKLKTNNYDLLSLWKLL